MLLNFWTRDWKYQFDTTSTLLWMKPIFFFKSPTETKYNPLILMTVGPKFPVFSHPTPINISIRPLQGPSKSFISLLSNDAAAASSSGHRPGVGSGNTDIGQVCAANSNRQRANIMSSNTAGRGGGCCTISWSYPLDAALFTLASSVVHDMGKSISLMDRLSQKIK